jgi:hypothetical protein
MRWDSVAATEQLDATDSKILLAGRADEDLLADEAPTGLQFVNHFDRERRRLETVSTGLFAFLQDRPLEIAIDRDVTGEDGDAVLLERDALLRNKVVDGGEAARVELGTNQAVLKRIAFRSRSTAGDGQRHDQASDRAESMGVRLHGHGSLLERPFPAVVYRLRKRRPTHTTHPGPG